MTYESVFWSTVLYQAVEKARAELPCWCGHPFAGHGGWLICAEREVMRLASLSPAFTRPAVGNIPAYMLKDCCNTPRDEQGHGERCPALAQGERMVLRPRSAGSKGCPSSEH